MSYNIDKQEKLYYKNKVSDIISSYEKQKEEEQKQKMLMKKQLMMSIMNNRQKSQIDTNLKDPSETTKQEKSAKTISHQEVFFDQQPKQRQKGSLKSSVYNQKPTYVPEEQPIQELKHSKKIQQITFNGKKRNKSLEEQLNFKESYLNLLKERRQKQQQQQQQELNKSKLKQKMQVQKATYNVYSSEEQQEQNKKSQIQKNPFKYEMKDKTNIPYSKSQYPYQEEEDNQYQVNPSQASNQEQNHGVFLTMEQSESMVAEDPPKNYAFQIKNNKSVDPQSFEELKRIKIKQIQRKRQERIQQFRRNQSQKKVQMPRGRSSYGKKIQKECLVEPQGPPTQIIERKSNNTSAVRKIQPKNERQSNKCIPLQPKDSQVSAKSNNRPNPSAYQQSRPPTYKQIHQNQYQQRQIKPLSPHKTPQTIRSQNRGKSSNNRNNIFQGQNQPRQKSSTKYTEPRIQPKDRKNSFNKQSNKKLMVNAINSVIFPGQLNRKQRQKFVQILQSSPFEFFIFLFKEYSRKMIKGIYVFDSTQTYLKKIYGDKSPSEITSENVQQFYRFDSGSREFKKLDGCKSFSLSIHAIDLKR